MSKCSPLSLNSVSSRAGRQGRAALRAIGAPRVLYRLHLSARSVSWSPSSRGDLAEVKEVSLECRGSAGHVKECFTVCEHIQHRLRRGLKQTRSRHYRAPRLGERKWSYIAGLTTWLRDFRNVFLLTFRLAIKNWTKSLFLQKKLPISIHIPVLTKHIRITTSGIL